MGQIIVRRIGEDVKEALRRRAKLRGVSMEEEARTIIRDAVLREQPGGPGLGTQIANLFRDAPDNDEPLPELPASRFRPVKFDE